MATITNLYNNTNRGAEKLWKPESDIQYLEIKDGKLIITQGNDVSVINLQNGVILDTPSTDPITLNLNSHNIFELDCTGETDTTITLANPTVGGVYTVRLYNVTSMNVTWPANVYDETETLFGTTSHTDGVMYTFYYNGTNFYAKSS